MSKLEIIVDKVSHEEAMCVINGVSSGGYLVSGSFVTDSGNLAVAHVKFFSVKPTRKQLKAFKRVAREKMEIMESGLLIESIKAEFNTPYNAVIY
nr:MAG TPA: hypothetical protein [Caudoviricetes sp.]